jgi:hypothetical protein
VLDQYVAWQRDGMMVLIALTHFPHSLYAHRRVFVDYDCATWLRVSWEWARLLAEGR